MNSSSHRQLPVVVLDRDGVLNHESADYIKTVAEWQPIPGSLDAVARLNQSGYHVVVATNQSGVGRGLYSYDAMARIHEHMVRQLAQHGAHVDAIFFCTCKPDEQCECRKPKAGMLREIAQRHRVPTAQLCLIGDSRRDLEAALEVGAEAWLVRTGNGADTEVQLPGEWAIPIFDDLQSAAAHLVERARKT
ncbi:MAG: D-glycero-beta-D-manno-heptose 1,7-bisphosphate 7-phosphatase [Pseudomonadota bacterium]